jgi:ActR/RegA family two-component response regulator
MQEIGITKSQNLLPRIAVVGLGWILILGGIVGFFVPIIPGAILIVVGALMVNPQSAWLRRMREKCQVRFTPLAPAFRWLSAWSEGRQSLFKKDPADSGAQFEVEMAHRGCGKVLPDRAKKMRQETQPNVREPETPRSIGNVLIFDEDIEDLARHAEPFEAQGFEVHKCMSADAAMRSVEREEFEFALVDQGSSAFEGRRVIRHLVRYNSHTPFVVVARCKETACCQQALALGAVDYLEKPVPSADMDRIIKCYIGSSLTKRVGASACDEPPCREQDKEPKSEEGSRR